MSNHDTIFRRFGEDRSLWIVWTELYAEFEWLGKDFFPSRVDYRLDQKLNSNEAVVKKFKRGGDFVVSWLGGDIKACYIMNANSNFLHFEKSSIQSYDEQTSFDSLISRDIVNS